MAIFSAYLGTAGGAVAWTDAMREHGAWLGLTPILESHHLANGQVFTYGWLLPSRLKAGPVAVSTPDRLLLTTSSVASSENGNQVTHAVHVEAVPRGNHITVEWSPATGRLVVSVPPATPEHIFYTRPRDGLVLATDMRLLVRWSGVTLDERGTYSLLQFGAAVPPFTVLSGVSRVPGGYTLEIEAQPDLPVTLTPDRSVIDLQRVGTIADPEQALMQALDEILATAAPGSCLFFSGGVDSALLALRAAESGRGDVSLVNLSFGDQDAESDHALQMAAALGLPCERVRYTDAIVPQVLDRLGRDYSFPFGDLSAIATNVLLHATAFPAGVIEGTGADASFGLGSNYRQWHRLYLVPHVLREAAGGLYGPLKFWTGTRQRAWMANLSRRSRRSAQMSLPAAAVLALNALDGIAYTSPAEVSQDIHAATDRYLYGFSAGLSPEERLSLLDLMFVCAGKYAAKSYFPLESAGTRPIYPFLEPDMIRVSSALTWEQKCAGGIKKSILKALLARRVPPDLVYRRKSTFTPPYGELFASPTMQAYLHDVVLSPENALQQFCDMRVVRAMVSAARHAGPLPLDVCEFLWTLVFTSDWIRTAKLLSAGSLSSR